MFNPTIKRRIGRHRITPGLQFEQLDARTLAFIDAHTQQWQLRAQSVSALTQQDQTLTHTVSWLCAQPGWTVTTLATNGLITRISQITPDTAQAAMAWLDRLVGAQTAEEQASLRHLGLDVPLEPHLPSGLWREVLIRPRVYRSPAQESFKSGALGEPWKHALPTRVLLSFTP